MKFNKITCVAIAFLVLISFTPDKADSNLAIIGVVGLGTVLVAGAALSPSQKANIYASYRDSKVNHYASTGNNMIALGTQAVSTYNSIGLEYYIGRPAAARQSMSSFIAQAQSMYGTLSDPFKGLLDDHSGSDMPSVGEIITNLNGQNILLTSVISTVDCQQIDTSDSGWCGGGCYFVKYNGEDYSTCIGDPPFALHTDTYYGPITTDPATYVPGEPAFDYPGFGAAFPPMADPSDPAYDPAIPQDIDDIISSSPPASVTPIEAGTGNDDTAPTIQDISEGEAIGLPPEPIPIEDAPPLPDPLVDNELLQGIYNNTLAIAKNTSAAAPVNSQTIAIVDAVNNINIDFDNSIVEQNTEAIKNTNQGISDRLESWEPTTAEVDSIVNGFGTDLDSLWTASVANMDNSIEATINNLEPIGENDKSMVEGFFLGILPAAAACTPLDFSFRDKEIIIGCEVSDNIKMFLSFFLYISTVFLIYTMVHRELRPNS